MHNNNNYILDEGNNPDDPDETKTYYEINPELELIGEYINCKTPIRIKNPQR